jgi:hypothetical protein
MYNTVFSEHYINSERGDNSKKAKKSIILKKFPETDKTPQN